MSSCMLLTPTPARSSLEEMLEALKQRDQKPKDVPPALPVRPTLRRRHPSSRRSLPLNFKIESNIDECLSKDSKKWVQNKDGQARNEEDKEMVIKSIIFRSKRLAKVDQPEENPHAKKPNLDSYEERSEDVDGSASPAAPSSFMGLLEEKQGFCNTINSVLKKEHPEVQPSVPVELEMWFLKSEAELIQKEVENAALQQHIQQYEMRLSEYEVKMKFMEGMWQQQVTSLQMSLAAAKKNIAANDMVSQPRRLDALPVHHGYDSKSTMFAEARTCEDTPTRQQQISESKLERDSNDNQNAVGHLVKEFEQHRHASEDDAQILVKAKQSGSSVNSFESLQKLKTHFAAWKKEYKVRLRKTKAAILGKSERERQHRRWPGLWQKAKRTI